MQNHEPGLVPGFFVFGGEVQTILRKLPKSIKLGHFVYKIRCDEDADRELTCIGALGRTSCLTQEILVKSSVHTDVHAVEIFLHECFHAICHTFNLGNDDNEERIVTMFGVGVTTLHCDNPWLAGWIADGLTQSSEDKASGKLSHGRNLKGRAR